MEEDKKKKQKMSIIIGVITLTIFVIGASFAYYIVSSSNITTTTAGRMTLEKAGTVSLTQGVSNIYLDVTLGQMAYSNRNTDYYGMSTETTPATTAQNHVLATIQATGGEDDTIYECMMGYSLEVLQINNSSSDAYAALESEDADFAISVVPSTNSGNTATNIADTRPLVSMQLVNSSGQGTQGAHLVNVSLNETGTSIVTIYGNTSLQITGDVIFHNLNGNQNDLAELGANVTFQVTSFSCNPIEMGTLALTTDSGTAGLSTGDVVTVSKPSIANQDFYVVSTNANETVLLSQYSLYVGRIYDTDNSSYTEIQSSASGYGLQSSTAARSGSTNPRIGVVPLSGSSSSYGYWFDGTTETLKSKYGTSYDTSDIYDSDYVTAPNWNVAFDNNVGNENYSIAYYIEDYVDRLGINGTGRLLTYTEAQALQSSNSSLLFTESNYWLGTAVNFGTLQVVRGSSIISGARFSRADLYGVRPVIVVPTSSIQTS